jgi:hypothetical protein
MAAQITTLSVTETNDSVTFSPVVKLIKIKNVGSSPCYFNLNDAATTSHFKLDQEDEIEIGLDSITTLQAICDTGETTVLQVVGSDAW